MLKSLKRGILHAWKSAGVFWLYGSSAWRHRRLAILCYHGISIDDEHEWDPALYISPELFEQRLQLLLAGGYHVLPLAEGIERLYAGTLPPKSVAITFDDGTFDFFARARPLLKKYGIPATVYLTTFYCHHPRPVFRLFGSYLLWKARDTFSAGKVPPLQDPLDLRNELGRARALAAIEQYAAENKLPLDERDLLLEQIARGLGLDYERLLSQRILQLMTPEEVSLLAADGIDVQLHTHRHRTPLDRNLFIREIDDNRREIESMTNREAAHFCYPCGFHRPEFLPWLEERGVRSATTCEYALASRADNPLLLPRIVDHSSLAAIEFESLLVGVAGLLPNRPALSNEAPPGPPA